MTDPMVREAVGVFHDPRALQAAVDELLVSGFDRSLLSLMATSRTVERSLGHLYQRVEEIADHPDAPHVAFVGCDSRVEGQCAAAAGLAYIGAVAAAGAVVASGGALALAIACAAAAGGTGGAIGAMLARFVDGHHARRLQEQLERGGILLWVRTVNEACERKACDILARNGATGAHVHDLPARAATRDGGVSEELAWINKPLAAWFGRRPSPLPAGVAVVAPPTVR